MQSTYLVQLFLRNEFRLCILRTQIINKNLIAIYNSIIMYNLRLYENHKVDNCKEEKMFFKLVFSRLNR